MTASSAAGIILAAGKGTRMKSDLPKGLHKVAGLPMVELVARAMKSAGIEKIVIVVGHQGEKVQAALGDGYLYVWQREQLGTGDAAAKARDALKDHVGPVVIAPGDAPLLSTEVIETLLSTHNRNSCTFATSIVGDPSGYGRIVRDEAGNPLRIVEDKDARPEQKAIKEVNASLYCFDGPTLFRTLPKLKNDNSQREYYLTDLVEILAKEKLKVVGLPFDDPSLLVGVNDRWQLAEAESQFRLKLLKWHAINGVTLLDPATTFIGPDVEIGVDTVIEPSTYLMGKTKVGARCILGPNTRIHDTVVGDDSKVLMSHCVRANIGSNVNCGPFANLRPGAVLGDDVKVGNFVEVKQATLGEGVSVSHLSYIGDATIGDRTNIGAGTITCNYDGFVKSQTVIGEDAFIGSNSTLIAPIEIGDGAMITAGSTVTHDVPAHAAAFGRARQETKEGWAKKRRESKKSQT